MLRSEHNNKGYIVNVITKFRKQAWSGNIVWSKDLQTKCESYIKSKHWFYKVLSTGKIRIKPLSAKITKWSNTLKQFVGNLPTNCLSVFDHFVGLVLEGLSCRISLQYSQRKKKLNRRDSVAGLFILWTCIQTSPGPKGDRGSWSYYA